MKSFVLSLLLLLSAVCSTLSAQVQQRRPIDNQHPLWLVHVDVWNKADPQKIIDLIPADVRPYVCMNLSLSCGYDVDRGVHKMPQNAVSTYRSWASICQLNGLWFTCQPASGGHTHILDDDLETFEFFFRQYPNFLGWNFAEQFWGFDEPGDRYSSPQVNRIALFARLIEMSHRYGGFLTVSFCGNIWSHALNPVGMMKRNADLLAACQQYPDAILWLYKYTTSSCFYNNESVTYGPFIAGLASNYGVRYDNCGWNGALDALLGEHHGRKYPVAAGIGTVMEQTAHNGGAVWDGPELIWTEDFQNLSDTEVYGYRRRNWGTFPGFRNAWIDMFRKVLDGTLYIPSRREVVERTQIVVVQNVNDGSDEDRYAAWGDLYDGLYKQTDPFNPGNGQWMDNYCYFKSTGRYGAIPIAPMLNDSLAQAIPTQVKKTARNSVWSSQTQKRQKFNAAYPAVSEGDLFVARYRNQLVTYTPYTYLNKKKTASAQIPLQYNTCERLDLSYGKLSSGLVREWADSITVYLNNYRSDTTTMVEDRIAVVGAIGEPSCQVDKRAEATCQHSVEWDEASATYTISVKHNGPVDVRIYCQGEAADRQTDVLPSTPLSLPRQPEPFYGTVIKEAEDMDYRDVQSCVTDPYNWYPSVYGHSGNGFMDMGSNKNGSLKSTINVNRAGDYRVTVRYMSASKNATIKVKVNATERSLTCPQTPKGLWGRHTYTYSLKEGSNSFILTNSGGTPCYIDQVEFTPDELPVQTHPVTLRQGLHGSAIVVDPVSGQPVTEAAEGDSLQLVPQPDAGYAFLGWNVIHGRYFDIDPVSGIFRMPDDLVTLEPLFQDVTAVYTLDFQDVPSGSFPEGWQAIQGDAAADRHAYPNSYSSGARTFSGFTGGVYPKALYWRVQSASYGLQSAYRLSLQPGNYRLTYVMAAWKGSPQYRARVLTVSGTEIESSVYQSATPCANGDMSANLTSSPVQTLDFTVSDAGNYVVQFENNGQGFDEFLLLACRVNSLDMEALTEVMPDDVPLSECQIFLPDGRQVSSLQPGFNILYHRGREVRRVFLR